jgi:hypothetical protein
VIIRATPVTVTPSVALDLSAMADQNLELTSRFLSRGSVPSLCLIPSHSFVLESHDHINKPQMQIGAAVWGTKRNDSRTDGPAKKPALGARVRATTLAKPRPRPVIACSCAQRGKDASQPISGKHVNPREIICELKARLIRTTVLDVGFFIAQKYGQYHAVATAR